MWFGNRRPAPPDRTGGIITGSREGGKLKILGIGARLRWRDYPVGVYPGGDAPGERNAGITSRANFEITWPPGPRRSGSARPHVRDGRDSSGPPAAVHHHGVAGDVARLVRDEVAHRRGDVLGGTAPARGDDGADLLVVDRDAPPAHVGDVRPEDLLGMRPEPGGDRPR